jgi:serine protease Do
MNTTRKRIALSLAVAAVFSGGYFLHEHENWNGFGHARAAPTPPAAVLAEAPRAGVSLPNFADIAATQGPAVVNVSVSGTVKTAAMQMPDFDADAPFSEFFRRFGVPGRPGQSGPQGRIGRAPTHGLGSGFIVSPDGVVLTNAHVVDGADEVTVKLTDKREFKAKVVGVDKQTDVAVLRIDARNLPTVKIGNSDQTRVGEWVVAIGSPFGFENSVTAGIISAKSRTLPDEGYVPFMQTDVAINPGNSGGPLFNLRGEVVGINSQIYSRSGGYQGLSFAIPIDVAMNVEQQLVTKGKVSRGRLGVTIQDIDQGLADSFGLDRPRGALVSSVDTGSPAAKAGIEAGDIILKFNGKEVARSSDLPVMVASSAPGSDASVELWRKGGSKEIRLSVGEMGNLAAKDDDGGKSGKSGKAGKGAGTGKLGLTLRPLTGEEKSQVEGGRGLVVEDVADGPAARAGIQPGDVIVAANGEHVASVDQLRSRVEHADKIIALLVQRGDRRLFVPIKVG